jgi:diguanylate cyclase (GGDEF)-like protein
MRPFEDPWGERQVKRTRQRHRLAATLRDEKVEKLEAEVARLRAEVDRLSVYRNLAYLDYLTGLRNRRYFEERLTQELSRATRAGTPCSVVLLDIDDFKRINDELGHPAGDTVLRAVGELLLGNQRTMDVACRIGGDELAVILPNTTAEGAEKVRERLEASAKEQLGAGRVIPGLEVSLSFGTATFPDDGDTADAVVKCADRRMYGRKRARKPSSPGNVNHAA